MKNKIIVIVAFLATTLFISSCLKDNVAVDWYGVSGKMYAQFTIPGVNNQTLDAVATPQTVNVQVSIASDQPPTTDIVVNLALDTVAMNDYNKAQYAIDSNFVFYQAYPTFSIPSSVTIKAGHKTAWITISITDADKVDVLTKWMVPIGITSAPGALLTANKNSFLLTVPIKNRYDGIYTVTGTMVDLVNPALTGNYPVTFELITSGPYQVQAWDEDIGGIYHSIRNGASLSYYGSFGVVINFAPDGSGNVVSVVNLYGQPAGNTRSAELDPSGVNKWDNTTHNMLIKYFMIQTNQPTGTTPRSKFDETWTYVGPR